MADVTRTVQEDTADALKDAAAEAKVAAKELDELRKKLEAAAAPARFSMEAFNAVAKATEEYRLKTLAAAFAAAGMPPVLDDMSDSVGKTTTAVGSLGVGLDTLNIKLKQSDADAGTLEGAYAALGVKSQALKDKELAGLAKAVDDVRAAMMRGDASAVDLKNATEAYAKAAGTGGGATTATKGFKTALDDLLGSVGTMKTDLLSIGADGGVVFGFGAAFDDLKGKAISLANEGIKLVIGKLTELIGLGPSLGSFGGIFKNALGFGSGASAGGTAAGGGGAAGAAIGGAFSSTLSLITGAVSAVTDIIGLFHSPLSGDIGKIEKEVRESKIHLSHILENWNSAYHGSGAWAWLLRGDTAEIAAALKGGVMLAPGATLPVTKAVDAVIDDLGDIGSALSKLDKSVRFSADGIMDGTVKVTDALDLVKHSMTQDLDKVAGEIDAIERALKTASDEERPILEAQLAELKAVREKVQLSGASQVEAINALAAKVAEGNAADAVINESLLAINARIASIPPNSALGPTANLPPGWYYNGQPIPQVAPPRPESFSRGRQGSQFDPTASNQIALSAEKDTRPMTVNVYLDGEPITSRVSEIQAGRMSLQR